MRTGNPVASRRRRKRDDENMDPGTPPSDGGALLDGRDIGTVIAPDADVKLWVDADVEQRGYRRWRELLGFGEEVSLEQVIQQLRERDQRDQNRKDAPAAMAADAVLIDTTDLTIEAAVEKALAAVEAALARGNRT